MLLKVASVGRFVLAVGAGQRLGTVVDLASVTGHLVLIGCQVAAALTLEGTFTCRGQEMLESQSWGSVEEFMQQVRLGLTHRFC